jgi:hypothetical protein
MPEVLVLVLGLGAALLLAYAAGRICGKAGFSPWLGVAALIPVANLALLLFLAFAKWPSQKQPNRHDLTSMRKNRVSTPTEGRTSMKRMTFTFCVALAMTAGFAAADPLSGKWVLNIGRTHYGGGAEPRKRETFVCEAERQLLRCTIKSLRLDGKRFTGSFAAAFDGKAYPATGIPDVDQVSLRKVDDHVADATFTSKGRPVFGYRAVKSDDGRSLSIVSVHPVSRAVAHTVVVYDRQ